MVTSKPTKQPRQKLYEPTATDVQIMLYLKDYHFLTPWQLTRLHYSDGSFTRAQTKLQTLAGENKLVPCKSYLARRTLPHLGIGNTTYIYTLSTEGQNYLKAQGIAGFTRFRRDEFAQKKFRHLEHALAVTDVLIAARNLSKVAPHIRLAAMQHDLDLKKTAQPFTHDRRLRDGSLGEERAKIMPDAWLDFRLTPAQAEQKERRRTIVLELDRGTEFDQEEFKKKIRDYVHYALPGEDDSPSPYETLFGTPYIIVAYATTAGVNRMRTLRRWCEEELLEQQLDQEANLFRFTTLTYHQAQARKYTPPASLDPYELFLKPIWFAPYQQEPTILLWKQ